METYTNPGNLTTLYSGDTLYATVPSYSYAYDVKSVSSDMGTTYTYSEPITDYIKRESRAAAWEMIKEIIQALKDTQYITKDIPEEDILKLLDHEEM